ncbi:MAG TPA: H-NS family nucleoid-associated regulatory protein [Burkholderiaceae bacterium]
MANRQKSRLSRAELLKRKEQLDADRQNLESELAAAHDAELASLVEAFKHHLAVNQFKLEDALSLLAPNGAARGRSRLTVSKPGYVPGTTYRHPHSGAVWTAKTRGATIKWLRELLAATGKNYADFAVKK